MTQTTGGMSARAMKVQVDVNAGGYVDVSGYGASVEPSGGDRAYGEQHTFDGDTPIIGWGKLGASSVVLKAVYTQTDAEPFDSIYDAKVGHLPVKVKWSIPGGASADKEYEVEGYVSKCTPPGGEAGSPAVIMFVAEIVGPEFAESVVA